MKTVSMGAGSGFWGDLMEPAVEMAERSEIQYLGFDHLSELTMAILSRHRAKDPAQGYIPDAVPWMRALLPVAHARDGVLVARTHGAVSAALISAPPYGYPLPPPPFVQRLWCFLGQGVQVSSRWNQVFKVLNGAHPDEPHWYLSSLGVDPPFQGRGIGGVLLSAWLADVDRSADPAYLETDMEVNLDFYHREGFEPVGELDVLGVRVWCMRRLPRK